MIGKTIFSGVLLTLLCFSTKVNGNCPVPCICPETTVKNLDQYQIDQAAMINARFNTTNTSWSRLATKFKAEIQQIYNCKTSTPEQIKFAELSIVSMGAVSQILDPKKCLSACTFAEVIEGIIEYYDNCCNKRILKVFDDCVLSDHSDNYLKLAVANAYKNLPCPGVTEKSNFTLPKGTCKDNGYCYDIEEIWELQGGFLSCTVRGLVEKMYYSKDCRDKYLAAAITYNILEFNIQNLNLTFDFGARTEFLSYATGPKIPECCCSERISKLNYLFDRIQNQKNMALSQIREKYAVLPECCTHHP